MTVEAQSCQWLSALGNSEEVHLTPEIDALLAQLDQTSPLGPGNEFTLDTGSRELLADKPILIGVCGAPRAGKDMVANHLVSTYFPAAKTTISDSIIAEVNEALAGRHLITHGNKSAPLYRRLLQEWGQARADQDPEYWTRQTFAVVEERFAAGDRLVLVTGIRRPAEVEEIQARGGELWMIKRPDNDYRAEHPVEEQLRQIEPDLIIENLGDRSNCLRTAEREIEVRFRGDPEPDRR